MHTRAHLALLLIVLTLTGCGSQTIYPVEGRLVDLDGNPITSPDLVGASVEFECLEAPISSSGTLDADGRFRLTTNRAGDGAHVGRNRVLITPAALDPERARPAVILAKYSRYDTSELEVVVEPKNNQIELRVERVRSRR